MSNFQKKVFFVISLVKKHFTLFKIFHFKQCIFNIHKFLTRKKQILKLNTKILIKKCNNKILKYKRQKKSNRIYIYIIYNIKISISVDYLIAYFSAISDYRKFISPYKRNLFFSSGFCIYQIILCCSMDGLGKIAMHWD